MMKMMNMPKSVIKRLRVNKLNTYCTYYIELKVSSKQF